MAGFAQTSDKSLKEALDLLTKEKKTRFIFERAVVDGLRVNYNWSDVKSKKAQDVLNELLSQVGLVSLPVGNNYFAIRKSKKPADDKSATISSPSINLKVSYPQDSLKPGKGTVLTALRGVVREKGTNNPVEGATLELAPYGLFAVTGKNGAYIINDIPVSRVHLSVSGLSMIGEDRDINLENPQERIQVFQLSANALGLKEVTVVAKENRHGSTSSTISKTAIEHLQAVSLSDIMQLLPGGIASNPDLNEVNKFSIRQVKPDNMGSLGTSIVINGAPISNNANLQVINTSTGGANAAFATSSGGGLDLRQFSTNNIESVGVIRGLPSVEHGDLTSGAVIIKTKAGKEPLSIKARINPRITQISGSKGFGIGKKDDALRADLDYTRSFNDQRFEYQGYHRVTGSLLYTKKFGQVKPFTTNTGFSYSMNLDEQKLDPDDKRYQTVTKAQDYNFRFNSEGKWELGKKFARQLQYNVMVNYSQQKGFQQQLISGAIYPLSYEMENVTKEGQFVPAEYLSQLWIDGKPLNVFAKLTNTFSLRGKWINHRVLMGVDWKTDANFGNGKTYDLSRPPRMQGGNGIRPRSYKEIPVMNQLAFFAEDMMIANVLGKRMALQAGIRFDNIQPSGIWTTKKNTVAAPRFNWSYEVMKDLTLRAGWGITAKAPTLLYLYPQNAYFDLVNYNRYSSDPKESLVYLTTRVFNTENTNLKVMKTNKAELGFDLNLDRKKRLTVMGYHEKTTNGYAFDFSFGSVQIVPLEMYKTISTTPGQKPVVNTNTDSFVNYVADYMMPLNFVTNTNKGIEFDLDMGRIDPIRTTFVLNGAYMQSNSVTSGYTIMKQQNGGRDPERIAVFDKGRGKKNERFNSTLRIIHNIPEFRFVVSLAIQTIWLDREQNIGYDSVAIGYITRQTGEFHLLGKSERDALYTAPNTVSRNELVENFSEGYHNVEKWKPLWLFNLRLSKDIGKNFSFAFFANNVFSHQPLERNTRYTTQYARRNPDLFFGTEVSIKL
jgi:hypothetical protein